MLKRLDIQLFAVEGALISASKSQPIRYFEGIRPLGTTAELFEKSRDVQPKPTDFPKRTTLVLLTEGTTVFYNDQYLCNIM